MNAKKEQQHTSTSIQTRFLMAVGLVAFTASHARTRASVDASKHTKILVHVMAGQRCALCPLGVWRPLPLDSPLRSDRLIPLPLPLLPWPLRPVAAAWKRVYPHAGKRRARARVVQQPRVCETVR